MANEANNYQIPFGLDLTPFFEDVEQINNGTRTMAQNVQEATRTMQNGFNQASEAGENLATTIQTDATQTQRLAENMRNAGRDIQNALNGQGLGNGMDQALRRYTDLITQFSQRARQPIKFDLDAAKLQAFEQLLAEGVDQLQVFNQVIDSAKQELATMDPGSEKFAQLSQQIQTAEEFLQQLGVTATQTTTEFQQTGNTIQSLATDIAQYASKGQAGLEGLNRLADQLERQQLALQQAQRNALNPELLAQYDQGLQVVNADLALLYQALDEIQQVPPPDPVPDEQPQQRVQSLRTQLRQMREELTRMAIAGQQGTQEFRDMEEAAGALQDEIGDVQSRIRALSSDTKYLDAGIEALTGLAGGFAAAQGAAALFGEENEDVNKVIQKVTAAMAILQGIQAVANVLNKDSALSTILLGRAHAANATATAADAAATEAAAAATAEATVATRSWTAALLANPFVLIGAAIVAVVTALIAFSDSSEDAKEKTDELNESLERQNTILGLDEAALKRRTDVLVAEIKKQGAERAAGAKTESEVQKIQAETEKRVNDATASSLQQRLKLLQDNRRDTEKLYNDENADKKKLGDELIKQDQQIKDLQAEIRVNDLTNQAKAFDDQRALNKKLQEEAKQHTEKLKQEAAKRQAIAEQQTKYAKQLRDAEAAGLTDDADRARAQARARTQDQIDQLNTDKQLSVKATEERDKIIKQLRANLAKELSEIDKKEAQDRAALELESLNTIENLQKDSYKKQLEQMITGFDQQRAEAAIKYKDRVDLLKQVNAAIDKEQERQTKAITLEGTLDAVDKQTERQVLLVETAAKFIGPQVKVEQEKQLAINKAMLEGAKKRLDALVASGESETSTVVLQAKKQVQDLEKAIGEQTTELATKKGTVDINRLIFGDLGQKNNDVIDKGLQKAAEGVQEITDFIVDQYQRQIDKKQEVIDQYDKDIDVLEGQLEKEQELRDQGFANNVDALQQEIDAKKAAREEELRQQEELQKKQQAAAKAKFAIDTALQASNLITASTEIFSSFAAIPFGLGIPLAIAVIAAMVGAFIAGRVKMYQAINSGANTQFGDGGWVRGKSHAAGGKKYYANDDSGDVMELEGDEYVVKKSQAGKYGDLLEAINNDDVSGMNDADLRRLLEPMGITLPVEDTKNALTVAKERDQLKMVVVPSGPDYSQEMAAIREDVGYLAAAKRGETERWEDAKFYYEKRGNKTTKIPKK